MYGRNFEIINNKCYTEDRILIYTIYVKNIPEKQGNEYSIRKEFSKFGKIVEIKIEKFYKDRKHIFDFCSTKASATVQFEKPEEALKAISCRSCCGSSYEVTYADSWKQPNQESLNSKIELILDYDENFRLLHLNDDCLSHIFSFLQLEDQLTLARLSKRLSTLLNHHYRVYKTFQLCMRNLKVLTLMQVRDFLIENGKAIESFTLIRDENTQNTEIVRILPFALKFCPHINRLVLTGISFEFRDYSEKIATLYPEMKMLGLHNCELTSDDIKNFSKLSKIKILDLSGPNNTFTEDYFENFKNLQQLGLYNCCSYVGNLNFIFMRMCENSENLEVLDIFNMPLDVKSFELISNRCQRLQTLEITICYENVTEQAKHLGKISSLRNLTISYNEPGYLDRRLNSFLIELINTELITHLEKLCLRFHPKEHDKFVPIGNCQNLKELFEKIPTTIKDTLEKLRDLLDSSSHKQEFALRFNKAGKEERLGRDIIYTFKGDISKKGFHKMFKDPTYNSNKNIQIAIQIVLPPWFEIIVETKLGLRNRQS